MNTPGAPSLEERRASLRAELRAHRIELAAQLLDPQTREEFPRSFAMRLLIRQPALAGWLVTRLAGARIGVPVTAVLLALAHGKPAR